MHKKVLTVSKESKYVWRCLFDPISKNRSKHFQSQNSEIKNPINKETGREVRIANEK